MKPTARSASTTPNRVPITSFAPYQTDARSGTVCDSRGSIEVTQFIIEATGDRIVRIGQLESRRAFGKYCLFVAPRRPHTDEEVYRHGAHDQSHEGHDPPDHVETRLRGRRQHHLAILGDVVLDQLVRGLALDELFVDEGLGRHPPSAILVGAVREHRDTAALTDDLVAHG